MLPCPVMLSLTPHKREAEPRDVTLHLSDGRNQSQTANLAETGEKSPPARTRASADHSWQLSPTKRRHPSFPGRRLLGIHPTEPRRAQARARGRSPPHHRCRSARVTSCPT